ncbi:MAG: hypothetical protein EOM05_00630 [Clostridia bacterium]|nr:hypothetical protein [Clostridia bacterium]
MSDINPKKSEGESTDIVENLNETTPKAEEETSTASKPKNAEDKKGISKQKNKSATKKESQIKADVDEKNQDTPKEEQVKDIKPEVKKDIDQPKEEVAEKPVQENEDELIVQELETIKSLVQQEVNNLLENPETGDWNELVKTARKEVHEAKEASHIDEDDLCEVCGERARDKSVSQSNPYCSECRELMKKHPFKFSEIVTPIMVIAVLLLSSWQLSQEWGTFSQVAKAQALVKDKKLYSAVMAYEEINTQLKLNQKVIGKKILENEIELYNKIGVEYYENTESFIGKYYSGENLDSFSNRKAKQTMTTIEEFNKVYEIVSSSFQNAKDYKGFVESFDESINKDKEQKYDKGMVEYWKYYAALAFEESKEVQLGHLKKMEKASPQYSSLYLPSLAELYLNMKDYDNMFKYCEAIESINSEDLNVKTYTAIAYRLKGDFAKATKSIKDGLAINSIDANLNHQMAIILLIDGKPKEALQYAKTAYDNSTVQYMYISNANLYALCAHLSNDSEIYVEMEEVLGDQMSADVLGIIEGSKTLESVFQKGEGDIKWN